MKNLSFIAALALTAPAAGAQTPPAGPEDSAVAIGEISALIAEHYFDAGEGAAIAAELERWAATQDFAETTSGAELAQALETALQSHDRHFQVDWRGPDFVAQVQAAWDAEAAAAATSVGQTEDQVADWEEFRSGNYGFRSAEILDGNIGYLALTTFNPLVVSQAKADAALALLDDSDSVVIDLRGNLGGEPELVGYLISHFLPEGERVHYNTCLPRDGEAVEMYTRAQHPAGHRPDVPLYILVSDRTFSAAEALAYHLQAMERAIVVGERTGGGGNPGARYLAASGFVVFVPDTTTRSPFTGGNWDGTGVEPDIAVPADDALNAARVDLLSRQAVMAADDSPQAMQAAHQLATAQSEAGNWVPSSEDLEACTGQYDGGRVWLEDGQLRYQGSGEVRFLEPVAPGVFRFTHTDAMQVHFPGYETGRARAMRQIYPSGDFFDRNRVD